jgi:hypothetical protein
LPWTTPLFLKFPRLQKYRRRLAFKIRTAYARYRLNLWLARTGHVGHPASAIFRQRGRYGKPVESSRSSFDFAALAQPTGFRDGVSAWRSPVVTKSSLRQADGRRSEAQPPSPGFGSDRCRNGGLFRFRKRERYRPGSGGFADPVSPRFWPCHSSNGWRWIIPAFVCNCSKA